MRVVFAPVDVAVEADVCWPPSTLDVEPEGLPHADELPYPKVVPTEVVDCLEELRRAGALNPQQATWLAQHWADLPDDWSSHPYLKALPEHVCAYIESLRDHGRWLASKQGAIS